MIVKPMSERIKHRLRSAAHTLGASDPAPFVGDLIDRSFHLPEGDAKYADNTLTPGAVPFEPSFSENEPDALRFTIEPMGPEASPLVRRDEATRTMRRLVDTMFGHEALYWFDGLSEDFRGLFSSPNLDYGAWFGTAYDRNGLHSSKIYYELGRGQLGALSPQLAVLAVRAMEIMPDLIPLFTTVACRRGGGRQRITFLRSSTLQLSDLEPLMNRLGMGARLPGVMQILGLVLGGRFSVPERSLLLGISGSSSSPELKLEVMLGMIPDLHPDFIQLLELGLSERPRQLRALKMWLNAYTPEAYEAPGKFSVLSVRVTPDAPARVSLYLRPIEFELERPSSGDSQIVSSAGYAGGGS